MNKKNHFKWFSTNLGKIEWSSNLPSIFYHFNTYLWIYLRLLSIYESAFNHHMISYLTNTWNIPEIFVFPEFWQCSTSHTWWWYMAHTLVPDLQKYIFSTFFYYVENNNQATLFPKKQTTLHIANIPNNLQIPKSKLTIKIALQHMIVLKS